MVYSLKIAPVLYFPPVGLALYDHISAVGSSQEQSREEKPTAVLQGKHEAQLGSSCFSYQRGSGIRRNQVHCLHGHNLRLILSFSLHFHATEIRSHFCEGWCIFSVSSKLSSCHLSQKDLGSDVLFLFEISETACVQVSPPMHLFSAQL